MGCIESEMLPDNCNPLVYTFLRRVKIHGGKYSISGNEFSKDEFLSSSGHRRTTEIFPTDYNALIEEMF